MTTGEPATSGPGAAGRTGYAERLWPSPWVCLVTGSVGAALGIVVAPIDNRLGVLVGCLGLVAALALLAIGTPVVAVGADRFVAGRAAVPPSVLGAVEVLDAAGMSRARGPQLDARAYLCLRGWVSPGVRVQLLDADDPTPYWLVSSRRPAVLAASLAAATAASRRPGGAGDDAGGPGGA